MMGTDYNRLDWYWNFFFFEQAQNGTEFMEWNRSMGILLYVRQAISIENVSQTHIIICACGVRERSNINCATTNADDDDDDDSFVGNDDTFNRRQPLRLTIVQCL